MLRAMCVLRALAAKLSLSAVPPVSVVPAFDVLASCVFTPSLTPPSPPPPPQSSGIYTMGLVPLSATLTILCGMAFLARYGRNYNFSLVSSLCRDCIHFSPSCISF